MPRRLSIHHITKLIISLGKRRTEMVAMAANSYPRSRSSSNNKETGGTRDGEDRIAG